MSAQTVQRVGALSGSGSALAVGALIGGRWWVAAIIGMCAALVVPTARRAASVQAGACLALVAGAAAHDRPVPALVAVVGCLVSLELQATARRATIARPRVAIDAHVGFVVAGTLAWGGLVVAAVELGPDHSMVASLVAIVAVGAALTQSVAARRSIEANRPTASGSLGIGEAC